MKKSLPKPAHLEIRIDEWRAAQGDPDGIAVIVEWRGVRKDPAFADLLTALPPSHRFVPIRLVDGRNELAFARWKGMRFGKGPPIFESARSNYEAWAGGAADALPTARKYLTEMIRQYLPSFDDYTDKKQVDFIIRTQEKINKVRDSLEELIDHLEYAESDNKATPPLEDPRYNVQAAVFTAMSRSTRRAGKLLNIPLAPSDKDRNENQRVRYAANRGRELLIHYFGEAEWKAKVERMRKYRRWWEYLESIDDSKEQFYAMLAKVYRTSAELERLRAEGDGFDKKLEEWVAAYEQKVNAMETFRQTKDDVEIDDALRAEDEAYNRMLSIQHSDERFGEALSLFDRPPQG